MAVDSGCLSLLLRLTFSVLCSGFLSLGWLPFSWRGEDSRLTFSVLCSAKEEAEERTVNSHEEASSSSLVLLQALVLLLSDTLFVLCSGISEARRLPINDLLSLGGERTHMKRQAKPQSMAKSRALSTRAKPSSPMPINVPRCSGVIAMLVSSPLKSTPTPSLTVPIALNERPAAMYSCSPSGLWSDLLLLRPRPSPQGERT